MAIIFDGEDIRVTSNILPDPPRLRTVSITNLDTQSPGDRGEAYRRTIRRYARHDDDCPKADDGDDCHCGLDGAKIALGMLIG